jgi:prepilin-type N-terminal cleavage/methylation domain-containing protein
MGTTHTGRIKMKRKVSRMNATRKGFTLIELMAASAIAVIVLSLFVGAYQTAVQHYAMAELPQRGDQIATSMYYYYLDTGVYPAGTDRDGLANLYVNSTGVAGWKGPYLRLQMEDGTADPWGRPFIYRRGTAPSGQPVFLLLSRGRNGEIDSDLSAWSAVGWDADGDDWARVFSERAPIAYFEDKTYHTLRFVAGMVYNVNPGSAPATFDASRYHDAWGQPIVYFRCNDYSAVLYTFGANGDDNSTGGTAICASARKQRDDLYVAMIWNGARPVITPPPEETTPDDRTSPPSSPEEPVDDCLRWLPPPWQPTSPSGSTNPPPWQTGTRRTSPPWRDRPPGRPWRDPRMPCRGVDRNFCGPGDPRWGTGSCIQIR